MHSASRSSRIAEGFQRENNPPVHALVSQQARYGKSRLFLCEDAILEDGLREETSQRIRLHNSSGHESCAPPIVFFSLTAAAYSCLSGTLKGPSSVTTDWIQKKAPPKKNFGGGPWGRLA
jgi:hypothetical protein